MSRTFGQPYVDTTRVAKVPGLTFLETRYATDLYQPPHTHQNASLYMVLQGSLIEFCDRDSLTVTPGSVFFLPAGQAHANRFLAPGAKVFSVWLDSRWEQRLSDCSLALDIPAYFPGGPLSGLTLRLCHEARETDAASPLVAEGLALEILGQMARGARRAGHGFGVRSGAPPRSGGRCEVRSRDGVSFTSSFELRTSHSEAPHWLRQAREMIQERFAENLTLEEIAAAVGVHPAHLATTFRRKFGCTVGDAVRRLRIEYACREVARSRTSLIEIALDAGFANQSHFTRVFKRLTGVTPAEYRRAFSSR